MAHLIRVLLVLGALLGATAAHAEVVSGFLAAIGSITGATGAAAVSAGLTIVTTVVSLATTAYANSQAKRKARQEAARKLAQDIANLADRRVTLLQSDSPNAVVYGSPGRIGGSIVAMVTTGAGAQLTHLVVIFAAHPCEGIDEIYIEDDPVQAGPDGWTTNEALSRKPSGFLDYDNGPMVHVGIHLSPGGVDVADQWLIDQCNGAIGGAPGMWTAEHRLSGYTYAVVTVNKVMERFQGGPPSISARVRGKNTIYDFRTGTRGYTRNPALCLADFIMSREGYGASISQIETGSVIAAANACDFEVYGSEADDDGENYGWSRARYVCDGMFRSDQDRDSTRQQLEDSMAGFTLQAAGVWRMQAGAWSTPVLVLGDTDMLAPTSVVQTCNPGERVYNTARGTYINAERNGVSEDFTAYQNAVFLGLDPHEKATDLALAFTGSHVRCHQLARVLVERSRGGLVLKIRPKMLAWHLQPGDRVVYSSAFYGIENKPFIVTDWSYTRGAPLTLELLEDVPAYYDTADEVLADAAPNSNLPNPYEVPPAPQNLQVESGPDQLAVQGGSVIARARVSWNRSTSSFVLNGGVTRAQWREGATDPNEPDPPDVAPWKTVDLPGDAVETFLLGLDVGNEYTVRLRFQTAFNASAWAYAGHLLNGAEPPAEVGDLTLSVEGDGIYARWSPPAGVDLIEWDRTRIGRGDTPEAAGGDVRFDGHATGANIGWFPAGLQTVWAVHYSRSGQGSQPSSASLDVLLPLAPDVSDSTQGRSVSISWGDCRTTQPIREYQIRKGDPLDAAEEIARTNSRTFTRVEQEAGLHRYWVRAVDMGGNVSGWGTTEAMVLPQLDDVPNIAQYVELVDTRLQRVRDELAAQTASGILRSERAVTEARKSSTRMSTILEAKVDHNYAIYAAQVEALVAADEALVTRTELLSAGLADARADILEEQTVRATADAAFASSLEVVVARVGDIEASYVNETEVNATVNSAIATNNTYLQSAVGPIGELSATVSSVSTTMASLDGNVAAQMMLKTEISAAGKRVIAGIKSSVSSTNGGADVQSEVVVLANLFRVMNDLGSGMDAPFKVQDGRTYIDMAMIRNAEIDTLKVAGGAIVAPAFASGSGAASVSFTVPGGQIWEVFSVAEFGQQSGWGAMGAASQTRSLTGAGISVVYPDAQWQDVGEGGGNVYRFPASMMTGVASFGPGFHTVTAVGGETTRLAVFIGKRGG
ncbi:phage tail tip fiber protein [Pseudacidovorax sp. NFM-22]|uniref:phage tail tip fiber protein n=1 Tax=Pseudacidovorax sp. NFM-22 TaxID=2744469 RepID=UPI001F18D8DE|nr:DUF1983 domain-containing protein [Pseudacidovorax sp. NFM-22]